MGVARSNLAAVRELALALPVQAVLGRHAYHTHSGVPGGDAVVMLAAAAPRRPPGWIGTGERTGDPRPPLDVLVRWANVWRARTGPPDPRPPVLDRVAAYLDDRLSAMAADPAFPDLAEDLARLLHQVENVLHAGARPDVSRVPCWDCGARLHKVWASVEADDRWRCPACGEEYDHGRYERAKRDHLDSADAERFVSIGDAVGVTGRPEQTVRAWARDGLVETRRNAVGRLEVWWPDVRDRDRVTARRRR